MNEKPIDVMHGEVMCPKCDFVTRYVYKTDACKNKYLLPITCKKCGWTMNARKNV